MPHLQAVFRVDASLDCGIGHVMRCLTLAGALRDLGATCRFVCRQHPGNLLAFIAERGYEVLGLPHTVGQALAADDEYAGWIGATWQTDAAQTVDALRPQGPHDWLIVDHYGLDEQWEQAVDGLARHVLVIDDLANRRHRADILLDQTLGRNAADYAALANPGCALRCGIDHVLLRAEFEHWRGPSLKRRSHGAVERIVVSLGGIDKPNLSRDVLLSLHGSASLAGGQVCVVLGGMSPWIEEMRQLVERLGATVELRVAVSNMAELLAGCDLAIGAAGTSAWERCCLGVPTLVFVLADNQRKIAEELAKSGAAWVIGTGSHWRERLTEAVETLVAHPQLLLTMSHEASRLVVGGGAERLAAEMREMAS